MSSFYPVKFDLNTTSWYEGTIPTKTKPRVLCIGCSWTSGNNMMRTYDVWECPPEQSFPSLLSQRFSEIEFWNCGIATTGTYMHAKYRLQAYIDASPDLVIFQIMEPFRQPLNFFFDYFNFIFKERSIPTFEFVNDIDKFNDELKNFWKVNSLKCYSYPESYKKIIARKDWEYVELFCEKLPCPIVFWTADEQFPYRDKEFLREKVRLIEFQLPAHAIDKSYHPNVLGNKIIADHLTDALKPLFEILPKSIA